MRLPCILPVLMLPATFNAGEFAIADAADGAACADGVGWIGRNDADDAIDPPVWCAIVWGVAIVRVHDT